MKIFISYRRADSKYVVDRIRDRLIATFGPDQIFRDVESIPFGTNFSETLEKEIQDCTVMLVVVGQQWLGITDTKGNKRLFDPNDYTRIEVEAGLRREGILVIPLLVMGMKMKDMPTVEELPESLRDLALRNGLEVREDPDFNHDMQRLITSINQSQGGMVIVQEGATHFDSQSSENNNSASKRQTKTEELLLLKHAITLRLENLSKQLDPPIEKGRNPYSFGQALNYKQADFLVGRESIISNILENLKNDRTGIVAGNGGSGKTSLLQAGLMPEIVRRGNLPILVSATSDSLEARIKKAFLTNVTDTKYLNQTTLSTFLHHISESLPQAKQLYIIIDRFENFLVKSTLETEAFKQEWTNCTANSPQIHWLFSIHLGFSHLLGFFRPEINPFLDLIILPPLDRESARQVILKPASIHGFKVESNVVDDILKSLGDANIDPSQLQTICYLMAGGNGQTRPDWTMADYEKSGRSDGLLSQSLEKLIKQLKPGDREAAWQILAFLAEQNNQPKSLARLINLTKSYGIQSEDAERITKMLGEIHLVDVEDEQYHLASQSILPRIEQWTNQQAALFKARQEATNQLRQLRNSALRGLFGGAIGFILFDQIVYTGIIPDLSFFIFFLLSVGATGGIAGFLLTLTADLSIAAYQGSRTWMAFFVGGIGGIIAFALGFLFYINNNYIGDALLRILPSAALEGALWGAVIGLGTIYTLRSQSRIWLSALITALISGAILMLVDSTLSVLVNEAWAKAPSHLQIFLAGATMPLCIITAALFRRPAKMKWNNS